MSDWADKRRVALDEPWSECWVEVFTDPQYGLLLTLNDAWNEAKSSPMQENIVRLVANIGPLLADYHIPGPDGEPIRWEMGKLNSSLIKAVVTAINSVYEGGGSADPLTSTSSPSRSSKARRSRRSSASGS